MDEEDGVDDEDAGLDSVDTGFDSVAAGFADVSVDGFVSEPELAESVDLDSLDPDDPFDE